MLYRMVIWRLRQFADECRHAREVAVDPSTQKELEEFERLFQQSASEVESTRAIDRNVPR